MKKKLILLISVLVVAIGLFIYLKSGKKGEAINFTTAKAVFGPIARSVTATGTIEPLDTVSVGAQVSGVVRKVFVDYNSVVKKGQLLAQVDPSILTAQDDESKAGLNTAKSNMDLQKSNFERQSKLYNIGAISQADYQTALNQYNDAKAAFENASAQVRVANKLLSYTNIYSPVDGVVLNRNISEGQTIASSFNAPVLFVIAKDLTKMQVNAAVDEADIGGVKTGQHVSFTVDAFPNDVFNGSVEEIRLEPSVSANVVTYTTKINVDNSLLKLKPGMTASINIYIEEDSNALLIPVRALSVKPDSVLLKKYIIRKVAVNSNHPHGAGAGTRHDERGGAANQGDDNMAIHPAFIWIKQGDTLVEKRIITGLADDANVKVVAGLSAGDEVITSISSGDNKRKEEKKQKSPFMPSSPQRPSGGTRY
ncbi:MAG: efflux RND transporter periplasmic adaptor subunit [Bacteroidetes bacterium]|nr:efflux RND transporter periplasmic adaptor subunit [Bacteroidota bacterium]